ncbi:MAG: hypothetical protein COY66_04845 [Candidatus Kerfeldbacteria bacterium CG_4_10_14_0_8_um_filter_42_10]|uniref:DUF3006 domain-containing protein n=1 Tax=Candidatus Kerfeldbacteria bacterium CG_4_10_14_0_8_um_filter_42_10 TaxID=2014248 RepID=A0A2M7RHF2_9BACT|nr:MAG: hypothetical protein COY66_04845 [Candidatus Kerfeldbacteria bacterium CG_4_10_14_0_8_um_filter_42_10]
MEARIIRIAEDYAILKLSNQEELKWPLKKLPSGAQEGVSVWLELKSKPSLNNNNGFSRDFLNEILKEDSKIS